ncbi:MAG: hypothetical protein COB66_04180 [Coxiella sp. (in: Bacteria)]|nr:MAG: hypothetical protein COB66_04180 [Coxiella sp. (in: g-proteobacteria)]
MGRIGRIDEGRAEEHEETQLLDYLAGTYPQVHHLIQNACYHLANVPPSDGHTVLVALFIAHLLMVHGVLMQQGLAQDAHIMHYIHTHSTQTPTVFENAVLVDAARQRAIYEAMQAADVINVGDLRRLILQPHVAPIALILHGPIQSRHRRWVIQAPGASAIQLTHRVYGLLAKGNPANSIVLTIDMTSGLSSRELSILFKKLQDSTRQISSLTLLGDGDYHAPTDLSEACNALVTLIGSNRVAKVTVCDTVMLNAASVDGSLEAQLHPLDGLTTVVSYESPVMYAQQQALDIEMGSDVTMSL